MYKTLGIKWLHEAFCPALAFVSADSDEARNPQRFIHVTVVHNTKRRLHENNIEIILTKKTTNNQDLRPTLLE
jgi:hypothetical protein